MHCRTSPFSISRSFRAAKFSVSWIPLSSTRFRSHFALFSGLDSLALCSDMPHLIGAYNGRILRPAGRRDAGPHHGSAHFDDREAQGNDGNDFKRRQ